MKKDVESSKAGLVDPEPEQTDPPRDEPASQAVRSLEKAGFEKQLGEMIEKEVNRRFQSAKDKRWAQLEKQYRELGELRELAEVLLASDQESPDHPGRGDGEMQARIRSLAELPGLKGNEEARALILRNISVDDWPSYARVMEALMRMTLGKPGTAGREIPNTAATAVTPGGGDAPADLAQAYQRRRKLLKPGDVNALTALKREFRQKGLDVF